MDEEPEHDRPPGARFALTPRALVIAAAVIALVALVVVLLGARAPAVSSAGGSGAVTVGGATPVGSAVPSSGDRGGAHAADGAGSSAGAGAPGDAGASGGAGARTGGAAGSGTPAAVVVHVAGAVAQPGVRALGAGARVQDAVDAAGGVVDGADTARVNLARVLVDGEQVYVPRVGEDQVPQVLGAGGGAPAGRGGADAAGVPGDVVDLNSADQAALETLPGIGPSLAGRILAWRTEHGRFSSVEDLRDVAGIGDVRFSELEPLVRV
ncbi:helix-hairpin-helix domain-containing protein [Curtobacterium sp. RRHDQ10]|uniref:helix-hairpin-helix domain-containing protein n=1 Tax=Curtobacterium phyllosphaerae TaxID=3413379 RepID=UPI003BF05567